MHDGIHVSFRELRSRGVQVGVFSGQDVHRALGDGSDGLVLQRQGRVKLGDLRLWRRLLLRLVHRERQGEVQRAARVIRLAHASDKLYSELEVLQTFELVDVEGLEPDEFFSELQAIETGLRARSLGKGARLGLLRTRVRLVTFGVEIAPLVEGKTQDRENVGAVPESLPRGGRQGGHSYSNFDVLLLTPGTATVPAASSPSKRQSHFERGPLMPLLLQGDFQNNRRRVGHVGRGGAGLLVMLRLLLPLLLTNESLGSIGIVSLHAGLHVLQLPFLGSQDVCILGPVLTQRHLSWSVHFVVGLQLTSSLTFSTPSRSTARFTPVLVPEG
ncbi:hypothetical protein EYF80_030266 [Liparis tanakae]|uniref:Uncharacterized protein n=1 Tax=Liparis tanakae TaxID=230148 RepID=A0A4Z2H3T4_9TELE|nr:hypothetical protein EYF80_030266 [Liparis tanakae]